MPTAIFPGRFDKLASIADFIRQAAKEAGLDEKDAYAVETAVDEACSNIIDHAYGGEGRGNITCSYEIDNDRLTIILEDQGDPFDPNQVPEPDLSADLDHYQVGGLGLYFIRKLMDEVHFNFSPGKGNTLIMIKRKEPKVG
ncbi:MAG TPA: ATP-binding protein [Anaerolineaceae bacterium]|jgi:serine/threonine-protein kinase RsbW|nr:ATP-binding protein [Anaerolineaceae bacterium]